MFDHLAILSVFYLIFTSGGRFGNYIAGDIISIIHLFLFNCFFGGTDDGVKECSHCWDNWLLVIHGSQSETKLVLFTHPDEIRLLS